MCPYSEFFWSVFSCIRTEYGEIRSVWENTDQKNSEYVDFLHSVRNSYTAQLIMIMIEHTAKNTVISSISWCENFVERHSFRTISGDSPKTMQKLCLPTKFLHQEIRWNNGTVFFAVISIPGYNLLRVVHPSNSKRGGVCIYYKDHLHILRIIKKMICASYMNVWSLS